LHFIFQDPGKLRKPILDENDITEGIQFIERWASDRSMLLEALNNLRSSEFLVCSMIQQFEINLTFQ